MKNKTSGTMMQRKVVTGSEEIRGRSQSLPQQKMPVPLQPASANGQKQCMQVPRFSSLTPSSTIPVSQARAQRNRAPPESRILFAPSTAACAMMHVVGLLAAARRPGPIESYFLTRPIDRLTRDSGSSHVFFNGPVSRIERCQRVLLALFWRSRPSSMGER